MFQERFKEIVLCKEDSSVATTDIAIPKENCAVHKGLINDQ